MLYKKIDRKDLAIQLRMRIGKLRFFFILLKKKKIGDWNRVI